MNNSYLTYPEDGGGTFIRNVDKHRPVNINSNKKFNIIIKILS